MGTSLQRTMALIPAGSLEGYIQAVNSDPVLSAAEEERELAMRLQQDGDLGAARQLVMSASAFLSFTWPKATPAMACLRPIWCREGNIGLMKAVKRFDPSVGVRLVSFAVHWIRPDHEYVLRNWRMVKGGPPPRPSASCSSTCASPKASGLAEPRRGAGRCRGSRVSAARTSPRWKRA